MDYKAVIAFAMVIYSFGSSAVQEQNVSALPIFGEWSSLRVDRLPARQILNIESSEQGTWTWIYDSGETVTFQLTDFTKADDIYILKMESEGFHAHFKLVLSGWGFDQKSPDTRRSTRMFGTIFQYSNTTKESKRYLLDGHSITFGQGLDHVTPQALHQLLVQKKEIRQLNIESFNSIKQNLKADSKISSQTLDGISTFTYSKVRGNFVMFTEEEHAFHPSYLIFTYDNSRNSSAYRGGYVNEIDDFQNLKNEIQIVIDAALQEAEKRQQEIEKLMEEYKDQ